MLTFKMNDNPAYVDIMKQIDDLNATWTNLQYLMDTAPASKNPFSNTNRCIRAQKFQCKMLDNKINNLTEILLQLQYAWEATTVW